MRIPFLTLLLTALLPGIALAQRESIESELSRLATELDEALAERRPWIAKERGAAVVPTVLGRYGPAESPWWEGTLSSTRYALLGLDAERLAPELRALHASLLARLAGEEVIAQSLKRDRWDPVAYVERLERMVADAELEEDPDAAVRRVLEAVPELWALARRGLVAPKREWMKEAAQRLESLRAYLRRRLDPPEAGEERRVEFDETTARAARVTEDFLGWLTNSSERVGEPIVPLGAENWSSLVEAFVGIERPIPRTKTLVLRELAQLERELDGEKELVPAPAASLEKEVLSSRVEDACNLAGALGALHGLPQQGVPLRIAIARRPLPSDPPVRVYVRGGMYVLEIAVGDETWPPYAARTRAAMLGDVPLQALALRHGPIGEAYLLAAASTGPASRTRMLWNEATLTGWGLFALERTTRLPEDPRPRAASLRREALRQLLLEACRLLASIEVHAEQIGLDEATASFERRSGVDHETAAVEIGRVSHAPRTGVGFLAYMELRALEEELTGDLEPVEAFHTLARLLATHLTIRPRDLVRHDVLGSD